MARSRLAVRLNPRIALCGLFAAAALTLAACGDSSTTTVITTGATSTAPTSTTTTTNSTTSSSSTATTPTGTSTTSDLRQTFDTALRQTLLQSSGATSQQVDCIVNELEKTVSDSEIQATISGQPPKGVARAAIKAGHKCTGR